MIDSAPSGPARFHAVGREDTAIPERGMARYAPTRPH